MLAKNLEAVKVWKCEQNQTKNHEKTKNLERTPIIKLKSLWRIKSSPASLMLVTNQRWPSDSSSKSADEVNSKVVLSTTSVIKLIKSHWLPYSRTSNPPPLNKFYLTFAVLSLLYVSYFSPTQVQYVSSCTAENLVLSTHNWQKSLS